MAKFHDFDPLSVLLEAQRVAQIALNNTQQLARSHNDQEKLLHELLQQHNNIVDLLMKTKRKLEQLEQEIKDIKS